MGLACENEDGTQENTGRGCICGHGFDSTCCAIESHPFCYAKGAAARKPPSATSVASPMVLPTQPRSLHLRQKPIAGANEFHRDIFAGPMHQHLPQLPGVMLADNAVAFVGQGSGLEDGVNYLAASCQVEFLLRGKSLKFSDQYFGKGVINDGETLKLAKSLIRTWKS